MTSWIDKIKMPELKRREFIKYSSLLGGAAVVGGLPLKTIAASKDDNNIGPDHTIWNACSVDCGSRCALQVHVKNDKITYVESDTRGDDKVFGEHQIRACLRGRSIKQRVYNPDRLKYPMKRTGKRGEGKFERISWDEALDLMADKLKYTIDTYGNESIFVTRTSGTLGRCVDGIYPFKRLFNMVGGYLRYHGNYSVNQLFKGIPWTYGPKDNSTTGWYSSNYTGSYASEIANTDLQVIFGYNPAETRMSGGGMVYEISLQDRKRKQRKIIIDPRYTDSMLGKEDQWIPIRPGTDAALVEGIAYVLITENLVDQPFLDKYCQGYDETTLPEGAEKNGHYKAHILGTGPDGIEKTPEWASSITGISVETIVKLAREIGTTERVFIHQGQSIQRQAAGEQHCRAITMLPILTGNIGLPGTTTGDILASYNYSLPTMPIGDNPIKASVPIYTWTDAVYRPREMTPEHDDLVGTKQLNHGIKFFFQYASGHLINQHSDINRSAKIIKDESLMEFIVVVDNHMTPSARYADLILPDITILENNDVANNHYNTGTMATVQPMMKAIEPMFECRSAYDICTDLAERFGIKDKFTEGRTLDQWIETVYQQARKKDPALPTLADLRKNGPYQVLAPKKDHIALKSFRDDPTSNPLNTPSGKIEIYSPRLAELANTRKREEGDAITPIPQYVTTWESHLDPKIKKYPMQLSCYHSKARAHSTYANVPTIKEAVMHAVWINPLDAELRGIRNGDMVRIWNDRGETRVQAKVTQRIRPGVMSLAEGAWYKPDRNGIDHGGCINVLTSAQPTTLARGNAQGTMLADIAKV